ncbi:MULTISPECIES: NAD(P)-dependent oxidoreductase [Rhizobium/Agrobacterium group]|uniref:NAD(P)-dependent oxidoreductase n=1 Tax=Agrobacterium vitis TaxID=373 RepID=A0ABD6H9G5_AGRVI|nr:MULTISPECIES: NAD(P)-dependent oxidoreductase [Rhizobium/Agrobacterium group]MUO29990.1 hypothetical protein [Agrobacterium vitis]MUO42354.1 hypothetical protein [Agrobacterium vitis]MUP10732.1 hypothetical protein [Agrobacterium vitis]
MIAVYGALGKIGRLVVADLQGMGQSVVPINTDNELAAPASLHDIAIWCATSPPPHNRMEPFWEDFQSFMRLLHRPYRRVIFTSSFGIETGNGVEAINAYAAGKIAAEAFLKAWTEEDASRSGVAIRMGGYGPLTDVSMPWAMSEDQILAAYRAALLKPNGYHLIRPLHQDWMGE